MNGGSQCRVCRAPISTVFADLGSSPLANSYLAPADLDRMEPTWPLVARVCGECWLVQLPAFSAPSEIFSDYAYFSSYSTSWLKHAEKYATAAIERFGLSDKSRVVEVASNDGYLLQYFHARGIPVLGIEPAANVARAAIAAGIPTRVEFFGTGSARRLADEGQRADLLVANNVFAHVPDVNDFTEGIRIALAPDGVATLEFPHLLRLIEESQFDTIYHEHFSYYSLLSAQRIFRAHGLEVIDVEELPTHGGSLRVHVARAERTPAVSASVGELLSRERAAGLADLRTYAAFDARVQAVSNGLLRFLLEANAEGKTVVGYGAPAKGNTLLNYCGVKPSLLSYTVDANPHKQGRYLPGTRIPIYAPSRIRETRPDYVLVLPWNLKDEIVAQLADVRSWGGRFVVPIPEVKIF